MYIDDAALKHRTVEWIQASFEIPAGTVDEHIESKLAAIEAEYKMYNHDGVDDGAEAFPDACEGCPHYGGGCPVVTQSVPQERLKQIAVDAESPSEFKRGIRNLARLYECHRIPEWLSEWNDDHRIHAVEGFEIYREINVDLGEMDSGDGPKIDLQAANEEEKR
jgi:hypothetical protein